MFTFTPKELFSKLLKNFFGQLFPPSLFFLSLSLFHLTHSLSFFLCLSDTSTNVKLTTNIFSLVLALARSLTLNTFAIVDSLSLSLSPSLSCSHTHPVEPQTFILPTYNTFASVNFRRCFSIHVIGIFFLCLCITISLLFLLLLINLILILSYITLQ